MSKRLEVSIEFVDNTGSFAIDALAQTFQGDWDSRSSTSDSGIVVCGADCDEDYAKEILEADDNVVSYSIAEIEASDE